MSKYIDADKLKSEIQILIDLGYDKLQGNLYHVLSLIASLQQKQPEVDLEKASRNVYESWIGGTVYDVRRDILELGKVLNARKEE